MNFILLTQEDGVIMGPVSRLLGWIMEGIFTVIDFIGIPNIGLAIILFTIVINLLMMPLTIKQQKYSKLSAKLQPEMQAIRDKYKNRKDEASMMAQNQEIQEIYAKYGVSPTGSCGYLLIQMPILFALYRVIYKIPAYVTKIGDTFRVLANNILKSEEGIEYISNSITYAKDAKKAGDIKNIIADVENGAMYSSQFKTETFEEGVNLIQQYIDSGNTAALEKALSDGTLSEVQNTVIDVLNKASATELHDIANNFNIADLQYNGSYIINQLSESGEVIEKGLLETYNNFLGINIANSPSVIVNEALQTGAIIMVIAALAIPVLSAVTQWINTKLIPQQQDSNSKDANDQAAAMAASMKTMNKIMPIMSAVFCYTMPTGMGIYWIAGSVVRSIQQVLVNKHMDNIDLDEVIRKNSKKSEKKMAKLKANQERMAAYASMNTKNIQSKSNPYSYTSNTSANQSSGYNGSTTTTAKPGSMMAKANMVKDFNEKNNK